MVLCKFLVHRGVRCGAAADGALLQRRQYRGRGRGFGAIGRDLDGWTLEGRDDFDPTVRVVAID